MTRPADRDLEAAVLGGLLSYPEAADTVCEHVGEDDFDDTVHRILLRQIIRLAEAGGPWGVHELRAQLIANEEWNLTGHALIAKITEAAPITPSQLPRQAKRLHAIGQARRLWETAQRTVESGAKEILADPEAWIARADAEHVAAMDRVEQHGPELVDLKSAAHEVMRRRRGGGTPGIPTGIPHYDRVTGGLHPGEVIVVGARTRVGKSAIAMTVADTVAEQAFPVLAFSLEMSMMQQQLRLLASRSGVDLARLNTGAIGDEQEREIQAIAAQPARPLWIDETPKLNVARIAARFRGWRRRVNAQRCLLVIDYLQLIEDQRGRGENREQEVARISRQVKQLARRERVPVMVLAQLHRGADKDDRPRLGHLRESGSIESDADTVWLLHRPEVEAKPEDKPKLRGLAELIVAKQRMGPEFTVRMHFDGPRARFTQATTEKESEA